MSKADAAVTGRSHDGAAYGDAPGKGAAALAELGRTGDSKTDIINRALSIYEYFERIIREGGAVYVRERGSEEFIRVQLL